MAALAPQGPTGYVGGVTELVDLAGASGAQYRFRRVEDPAQLPVMAGNFAYLRRTEGGWDVVCCGATNILLLAGTLRAAAIQDHGAEPACYIRLNVSGTARAREYEDLVAQHKPPMAYPDLELPR
jgi:hypothetical protein